ncbi:unnamed protein product [Ectocarpus sp. 12 AP-2014]
MSAPTKLFERITTCALSFRHGRKDGGPHESSYRRVKAARSFIRTGFPDGNASDRKVDIAVCVATSIAEGRDGEDRLVKAICDRFRGVGDFDRRVMKKIFSLSLCSDRALTLLDDIMVLKKKKGVLRDVERELQTEFILMFFDILANILKRGESVMGLGYVTSATPADMSNARATLERHAALIADKCCACFRLKAFKIPRPRLTIGCKHVDFGTATIDTLNTSLIVDDTKTGSRGEFLDIVFAIISQSHKTPRETYAGMKVDAAKTLFLGSILDKGAADGVVKALCIVSLKKQLRKAKKETDRIKAAHGDGKKELDAARETCEAQKRQLFAANAEILRLENRVKSEAEEVATWKRISHTPKEARLNGEVAALKRKWDECRRDVDMLTTKAAGQKDHLDRVIALNETLEKKACEMERRAKRASIALCARWACPGNKN